MKARLLAVSLAASAIVTPLLAQTNIDPAQPWDRASCPPRCTGSNATQGSAASKQHTSGSSASEKESSAKHKSGDAESTGAHKQDLNSNAHNAGSPHSEGMGTRSNAKNAPSGTVVPGTRSPTGTAQ